jgi:hypothetical protein
VENPTPAQVKIEGDKMKRLRAFLVAFVLVGLLTGSLKSQETAAMSPQQMEEIAKRAVKARRQLYQKFLPQPEDLGPGWLLPWQLPKFLRKFASEDEFWQSISENPGGRPSDMGPVISLLVESSPQELEKILEMMVSPMARQGLTDEEFLSGIGSILTLLRWETSPSLAKKMELTRRMWELAAEKLVAGREAEIVKGMQGLMTEPVRGMSTEEIKQAFVEEVTSVRKLTGMIYTKSDNWDALRLGEVDPSEVHVGHVAVKLIILDRGRMAEKIDDLEPEEVGPLQDKLNQALRKFGNSMIAGMKRQTEKKIAELEEMLQTTEGPEGRRSIEEEIQKEKEALEYAEKSRAPEVEVYRRDFGDNCYVINIKGRAEMPELTFSYAGLNASLRNGNAVVLMGLGGNFTPEQFQKELDHFLSEMDARTAFFRE